MHRGQVDEEPRFDLRVVDGEAAGRSNGVSDDGAFLIVEGGLCDAEVFKSDDAKELGVSLISEHRSAVGVVLVEV